MDKRMGSWDGEWFEWVGGWMVMGGWMVCGGG